LTSSINIALDAMGGDNAPEMVVEGTEIVRSLHPDARFILFGDEGRIAPFLARFPRLNEVSEVRHTDQAIAADEKPSQALRRGQDSSMRLAIDAVQNGTAGGVVSAGNTGALMAISKFVLGTQPSIDRPAMISFFPTRRGKTAVLDLGANIECNADNLVQFAVMGAAFVRIELGIDRPTVGLLNVGVEELKGNDTLRSAGQALREVDFGFEFAGFIEGNDICEGTVDVVVTDGFTGNAVLKALEGGSSMFVSFMRQAFQSGLASKIGYLLAKPAFQQMRTRIDPRAYNGAVFVGLNGISVKSHGGTDGEGYANAIGVAIDLVRGRFSERIQADLEQSYVIPQELSEDARRAAIS
tara:strand:+ start:5349 stop:6410 length:1062 start_codon:yes stop_codon:yes gene_type:complete